jgi:putative sugar O-methyltransferase
MPSPVAPAGALPDRWQTQLERILRQLEGADRIYAPTICWQPGVKALLDDLGTRGIEQFKSWPSSAFFFYPRYGPIFTYADLDAVIPTLRERVPAATEAWLKSRLNCALDANNDLDVALALLDRERIPLTVEEFGESQVGTPPQYYRPFGAGGPGYGKPYLNYLKVIAALSRHIDRPLRSVVEVGGGFGVLGEIVKQMDPSVQYVDMDIPPLSTIANYYLSQVFPGSQFLGTDDLAPGQTLTLGPGQPSACLSSWQFPQLSGSCDLFINTFSFQEMEPDVVRNYAAQAERIGAEYVVSMNSRKGKPLASEAGWGVEEQVLSEFINSTFNYLGYRTVARLGRPAAPPQAELLILRREHG